jgi:hypothetical protein
LNARLEITRIRVADGVAKLGRGIRLRGSQIARGIAHLLFELRKIVSETLAISCQSLRFAPRILKLGVIRRILLREPAHLIGLFALRGRQPIGIASDGIEASGALLPLHAIQKILGFAEAVGSAAGVRTTLLR